MGVRSCKSTATRPLLPEACTVLDNPLGTASGMWFDRPGGVTVSMPGVPYEMEHIMTRGVIPGDAGPVAAKAACSVRAPEPS